MKSFPLAVALSFGVLAAPAWAEPTRVMVRAQSLDAKFIGDQMGGVEITLVDAASGRRLAKGLTAGGTGDTGVIMKTPHARGAALSDSKTAGFEAIIDIDQPTLVRAEARGPMGKPASAVRVSSSLWVLPGRDVLGDGWTLTFPGLVIEPSVAPAAGGELKIAAKVTLMCGCPIEPDGLWNAANYSVEATLMSGRRVVARVPLTYAGQASQFAGDMPGAAPGRYVLRVVAADARTPNAGVVDLPVTLPRRP